MSIADLFVPQKPYQPRPTIVPSTIGSAALAGLGGAVLVFGAFLATAKSEATKAALAPPTVGTVLARPSALTTILASAIVVGLGVWYFITLMRYRRRNIWTPDELRAAVSPDLLKMGVDVPASAKRLSDLAALQDSIPEPGCQLFTNRNAFLVVGMSEGDTEKAMGALNQCHDALVQANIYIAAMALGR